MLNSLDETRPAGPLEADVAVIGAGLAGIVLADALTRAGLSVLLLESGGERQIEEVHLLNAVELTAQNYRGATEGRFRGLGGTSTRWGGALLPYLATDFAPHPRGWHQGWGIKKADLDPYLASLEHDFGVSADSYEGAGEFESALPSFLPRLPKWPTFQRRSTFKIYRNKLLNDPRLAVWINATVTDIRIAKGRIVGLKAQSMQGHALEARTAHVAIAAGAIETTRLLLLLDRAQGGGVFGQTSPLGFGFHDHLSAPIAELELKDRAAITRLFCFRFVRGGMRNLRFELGRDARMKAALPAAFLHVSFTRQAKSGFDGLRGVYQAIQRGQRPAFTDITAILGDLPWFLRAAWWRFAELRVLPPGGARFELHLVTEQKPDPHNRIDLSPTGSDAFGQPLARIHWQVHEDDCALFSQIAELARAQWADGPLSRLATLKARDQEAIRHDLVEGGGIYHPAGTTRMGASATEGVVDAQLRVHGCDGLWAVATSVFPTVGGASPSLGLMQLALRAADDIAGSIVGVGGEARCQ